MAAGYSESSVKERHDVIYDYCCSTCGGENLNEEALNCCKNCSQLFCEPCKKNHDKCSGVESMTSYLMCQEHPEMKLELYCEEHKCQCCSICISIKHRVCKQVKRVPDMAQGKLKSSRFKFFLSEAAETQSGLELLYDKEENNCKLLQKAGEEITSILQDVRKEFNQKIDRLEEEFSTEMDKLHTLLKEKVTVNKNICLDFHDKVQKFLHDFQNLGKQCGDITQQGYMKCHEQVANAEELLSSMQDNIYSVVKKKSYNVKTSGDTNLCQIAGMCQLPNGQTAIVDYYNRKVKLLRTSPYRVLDCLEVPPDPCDICHTSETELAVTVCEKQENEFIRNEILYINALDGKLFHIRTVQLDYECFGVAFYKNQLYVGSEHALYANSLLEKNIEKIYEDTSEKFSTVCSISVSDDGSCIYVTNFDKDLLLTLDNSGRQLSVFSDPDLEGPTGVCVADDGSVFVCGQTSHTILQLDKEGKRKITTLATKGDGVREPQSLCYDRKTNILLVGQWNSDNLLALQLKFSTEKHIYQ